MRLPTQHCQPVARLTRIALTAAICCWAAPALTQAQEATPTTKLKMVGKLIDADLSEGRLQLLIEDTNKVLVEVDARTKVYVQGKPSTLSALRNGDIIRVVTPTVGSRYARELHAARTETNPGPIDSNVGIIREKTRSRQVELLKSSALGVGVFDNPQQGVLVVRVQKGSPAELADVRLGDYILAFDGKQVETPDQLISLIHSKQPNDKVKLTLWRARKTELKPVLLTSGQLVRDYEIEDGHLELTQFSHRIAQPWFGVNVRLLEGRGVQVVDVENPSPAMTAGIRPGVILTRFNAVDLKTPGQLDRELDHLVPGAHVIVEIMEGKSVRGVQVKLGTPRNIRRPTLRPETPTVEAAINVKSSLTTLREQIRVSRLTAPARRDAVQALETIERQLLPVMP